MSSYITQLDCYLPKDRLFFKDHLSYFDKGELSSLFENGEKFMEFNRKNIGLESVIVETEKSIEEMAIELLDVNLDAGKVVPENIDYILLAVDWDDQLNNFGHYVQHEFEMEKAKVIRLSGNFCANIDMAIGLASNILKSLEKEQHILILTGSKLSNSLEKRIVGSYGVMGDSVGLTVISNNSDSAILEVGKQHVVTKGELSQVDLMKDNAILHFQSYYQCLEGLLENEEKPVDKIILHNSNQLLMEQVLTARSLDVNAIDKTNHNKYGHLGTTDLLLNLKTYVDNGAKKGDSIMSLNLGVVGTYVGTLFEKL